MQSTLQMATMAIQSRPTLLWDLQSGWIRGRKDVARVASRQHFDQLSIVSGEL